MKRLLLAPLFALLLLPAAAEPRDDVAAATQAWIAAFASHDAGRIAALYAPDAVFWGTNSPVLRDRPALVREYFENLKDRPTVRLVLDEEHIRVYGDVAIDSGCYTVHETKDGQPTTARCGSAWFITGSKVAG